MRKFFVLFVAVGVVALQGTVKAQGQVPDAFEGRWWLGLLNEAQLPLNITFERLQRYDAAGEKSSELTPVAYSPAQTKDPMYPTKWSMKGDTLRFMHSQTGVNLKLVWNGKDSTFEGTFRQGFMRSQMKFVPASGMFSPRRPQDPQPPFPYSEREVKISCKSGATLTGTLTMPAKREGVRDVPAVVLVSGSGQQNRDEELMFHRPFRVVADYLAREGIAVLRYDDRGTGGSRGEVRTATTVDFAADAEDVFKFLCKQDGIDSKHVGIAGHSEGALIACMVAARNKKVDFVVMLGGQAGTGAEVLLEQNELLYKGMGVAPELVAARLKCMRALFAVADSVKPEEYEKTFGKVIERECSSLTEEERKQISMRRGDAGVWAQQIGLPWMKKFLELDNSVYLKKMRQPVLAITGEKDLQVPVANLERIKTATGGRAETRAMESLNHLMQHCRTGMPEEYMHIEETFSPEVLRIIAEWILKHR